MKLTNAMPIMVAASILSQQVKCLFQDFFPGVADGSGRDSMVGIEFVFFIASLLLFYKLHLPLTSFFLNLI